jgi:hypothetical protein
MTFILYTNGLLKDQVTLRVRLAWNHENERICLGM